ncbi:MAG: phosphoribosylamine--glycine ligase, partial [Bacteroidetes bacterium SW_10_40_5]
MESINVLLLGSGGREHALAWKIKQSDYCKELYVAPGNAGTGSFATNVTLNLNDYEQLQEFALAYQIDLVVVGSEGPLVGGIVDFFKGNNEDGYIPVFGPCSAGASLEGSKIFAKEFMHRHRIPTGSFDKFSWKEHQKAINYLQQIEFPVVIKANGLASGKGVKVCENQNQALETLEAYFKEWALGDSGKKIVIEEFLEGQELSMFVLTDGDQYIMLPDSKDYKRVGEGDKGPNTGGMGAISPSMYLDNNLMEHVKNDIIIPTLNGLKHDGIHYKGFLYFGVIVTADGPKVLEYN